MTTNNTNNIPLPTIPVDELDAKAPELPAYDVYKRDQDGNLHPLNPNERAGIPSAPDNECKEETLNGQKIKVTQINNQEYIYMPAFTQMPRFSINDEFKFNLDELEYESGSMNMNSDNNNNDNNDENKNENKDNTDNQQNNAARNAQAATGNENNSGNLAGNLGNNDENENKQDLILRGWSNVPGEDIAEGNMAAVVNMNRERLRETRERNARERRRNELLRNNGINSRYLERNMNDYTRDILNNDNQMGYFDRNSEYRTESSLINILGRALKKSRTEDGTVNIFQGCKWMLAKVRTGAPNLYYSLNQQASFYGYHSGIDKISGDARALFAFSPLKWYSINYILQMRYQILFAALNKELYNNNININNVRWLVKTTEYVLNDYSRGVTWLANNSTNVGWNSIEAITSDKKFISKEVLNDNLKEYILPASLGDALGANVMGAGANNEYGGYVTRIFCKNILDKSTCTHGKSGICKQTIAVRFGGRRHGNNSRSNYRRYNNYNGNYNNGYYNNNNGGGRRHHRMGGGRRPINDERKDNNN